MREDLTRMFRSFRQITEPRKVCHLPKVWLSNKVKRRFYAGLICAYFWHSVYIDVWRSSISCDESCWNSTYRRDQLGPKDACEHCWDSLRSRKRKLWRECVVRINLMTVVNLYQKSYRFSAPAKSGPMPRRFVILCIWPIVHCLMAKRSFSLNTQ